MSLGWRTLRESDLPQVATWNRELQEDEGSVPMTAADIRARLERWRAAEYDGVLFDDGDRSVGYALYRRTDPDLKGPDGIYIRQFFIARAYRRKGYGRRSFELLRDEVFPAGQRIVLEAVSTNPDAHAFWRALGFRAHSVMYELGPSHAA